MSVSSISASAPAAPPAQNSAFRNAFQQLTTAIGSGDLQTAQQAYATITSLQPQQGSGPSNGPMATLLSTLGQALTSGDLTSAQSSLADFQKSHGQHHHHAAPPSTNDGAAASTTTTGSSNVLDVSA
ncbi:MAG: hypothetical protein JWP86_1896 [Phenylobacterium sp.]|nr:hypothetical protein [Phenylobacterium sp.]